MATREQFKLSRSERQRRTFSENFKKQKIREMELGLTSASELSKAYEVSVTSVYRWLAKFGSMKDNKERLVVENQSDTVQLLELKKRLAELERIIGQKQLLIDFQQKMIDLAEEEYGIDIKKKLSGEPLNTIGKTGK